MTDVIDHLPAPLAASMPRAAKYEGWPLLLLLRLTPGSVCDA